MKRWLILLISVGLTRILCAQEVIPVPVTQQSLVTKLTATWCPICGGTAWNTQKKLVSELSTEALVLSAHISNSSRLYSPTAEALLKNFDPVVGQPYFFFNRIRIGSGGTSTENTLISNVQNASNRTPVVQAGLTATVKPGTREISIACRTEFFQQATGDYFLSFLMLEDSVSMEQSGRSSSEIHRNVLRTSLMPEVFGRNFASGSIAKGASFESTFTSVVPASYQIERIRIAAVIWKRDNTEYDFVNVNVVPLTPSSVTSVQELTSLSRFEIWPNPLQEINQVRVELKQEETAARLELVDATGKLIKTVYTGALTAGSHDFSLLGTDFGASGIYFLRLSGARGQATRQLVFTNNR